MAHKYQLSKVENITFLLLITDLQVKQIKEHLYFQNVIKDSKY